MSTRYLYDRDLQREIEEGLNVVEAWKRANSVICYGRRAVISRPDRSVSRAGSWVQIRCRRSPQK
ncbi:Tn3 family transposase [Nonomuraea sp. JJY05]|uniref:Tn3 family transposase n=1 Tax=Nonomuraea sp. JJY05 TaxID=3350255 RepID=UPI00373E437A